MLRRYIFKQDCYRDYINAFNRYAIEIMYGPNILIGSEIENEWKDEDT